MEQSITVNQSFESWAIIELLGHQKYAGKVDEVEIAGSKMIRITVPAIKNNGGLPEFQKIVGTSTVYAITPVGEDYAKEMAEQLRKHPIEGYEHKTVVQKMAKALSDQLTLAEVKNLIKHGELPPSTVLEDDLDFLEEDEE